MKRFFQRQGFGVVVGVGLVVLWQSIPMATGQNGELPAPAYAAEKVNVDDDPFSDDLLLTERGKQLTEQLAHLRRIESTLGAKHPSMDEVQAEIEVLQAQLDAWSLNPLISLAAKSSDDFKDNSVPDLSLADMRSLILQMAVKIDRLETRIGVLERRQRRP